MLVVYVSPFTRKDVYLFLDRLSRIEGVEVGLISTLDGDQLSPQVAASITAYWQVSDLLDVEQLVWAARGLSRQLGPIYRMFTEYELIQLSVAVARAELDVPGMSPSAMLNFRDKAVMKERLTEAGVPCARHRSVESAEEAREFADLVGFPLIIKPLAGVGARETHQCDDYEDLEELLATEPPSESEPLQFEEFMTGQEHTLDTVSVNGQAVWHSITRYIPNPLEVLRNPWMQWRIITPREIDIPEYDDIRRVGERALHALGMDSNISHLEWFRRPNGSVAVSEVGARPPGSRIFTALNWANDYDMYNGWIRLMVLNEFTPPAERKYAVGTAFIRGVGTGEVVDIRGLDEVLQEYGPLLVETELPHIGQVKVDKFDGQGYLMLRHPDTRVVEDAIADIVSRVRVDIG